MSTHRGPRFWAYLHCSGLIVVRRYNVKFDRLTIRQAEKDDMIDAIFGPFYANDEGEAMKKARPILQHQTRKEGKS